MRSGLLVVARLGLLALAGASVNACGDAPPPPANDPTQQGSGSGPLAQLEAAPFSNEVWAGADGNTVGILYYAHENIRVSASCRGASGQFTCLAMDYLRNGAAVEMPRRAIDGRTSAGVKVCLHLNQPIVIVHNSVGSEDGFCRFPDGSLLSNGALEQYKLRVLE